ncbi:rod shape-determining protein MreD [Paenibacillus sp. N1-5-1-14]|uniref:rod shape-determining protein MreD n=1 Tax=Paenibacillus radicibacter TaxID=2972488 RepID=UPI00215973A6|nr:rod shape-determining protein MreD [Paenibacillus radicibacter]MCR8644143.1 rod shape-determining protein MreD [Paenibacillus radicibacter]
MRGLRRHYRWLLLLLLFIVQGTLMPWILPESWQSSVHISPNFVLVIILYYALYLGRHQALLYGVIFGLLQDFIYYGHMIGVFSFAMGLTGYLIGLMQVFRPHFVLYTVVLIGVGVALCEMMVGSLYLLFNVTKVPYMFALTHYVLPSALFNMLFALAIYIPMRKWIDSMNLVKKEGEAS